MTNDPLDKVLSRLDGIRPVSKDRYLALCPAHPDKSPSLSIRRADDSRILLHCFTGCSAADILAAIGLEFRDLFPTDPSRRTCGNHRPRPSRAALATRDHARMVLTLAAADIERGVRHSAEDQRSIAAAIAALQPDQGEAHHA